MSDTINNGIPLVPENTIDPAAGLNEALNVADALIQVDVISLTVTTPPASPVVGDRYIVPTGATGAWSGQAEKLARWEEGLFWAFYNAQFVTNNGVAYTKTSGGWAVISGSGEANTTSNLGAGEGIAAPKSGVNLPFKSLKAGANVTITSDADEITISSTGGGGGSSVWGGIGGDIEDQTDLIDLLDEKEFALVAGTNITINRSNPKAPVISASGGGGGGGQVDSVTAGEGITVDNTDPENPEVSVDFSVAEYKLTAGANITIDRTDPDAPVISATGSGGGGGDVVGPSSATANALAQFDGATGKLLKSGPLVTDFATAAQGALADTAVQPSDLSDVAVSGDYDDLINKPTLGTAAAASSGDFATAAQGELADTALQDAPEDGEIYARQDGDWVEIPPALSNPMTTAGDMIVGGASGVPARLAGAAQIGSFMTYGSAGPKWAAMQLPLYLEYLIVAGGGSGGSTTTLYGGAGGGGAGGILSGHETADPGGIYSIVIGSGGAARPASSGAGANGGDSSAFDNIAKGGGGGSGQGVAASSGGSGGGAGASSNTGAAGIAGQGSRGGNTSVTAAGAGGGGYSSAGNDSTSSKAGDGGSGFTSSITGTPVTYGGGGGGSAFGTATKGLGGYGGGGEGGDSTSTQGASGVANTGGGGGGQGSGATTGSTTSGAGGSGAVIIRYLGSPRATGGTITEVGGYTIHTFTSSGTFEVM